jgi:hypothetical protein
MLGGTLQITTQGVVMSIQDCVVARQPRDQFGVHITNMGKNVKVPSDIVKGGFHDTRIAENDHTILERGHINISTSKRLICPPTGNIEGRAS